MHRLLSPLPLGPRDLLLPIKRFSELKLLVYAPRLGSVTEVFSLAAHPESPVLTTCWDVP